MKTLKVFSVGWFFLGWGITQVSSFASHGFSLDDIELKDAVDSATFIVGRDKDVGRLMYIVDRTHKICYAALMMGGTQVGLGMTTLDCEKINKTPRIKEYWESGKLSDK